MIFGLEYYQPLFIQLSESRARQIEDALHGKPPAHRAKFVHDQKRKTGAVLRGNAAWQLLREYCVSLEGRMREILRRHSVYFWIHLYRRIGVRLSPQHVDKTDQHTLALVRQHVELAILKFANVSRTSDIVRTRHLSRAADVLGGKFAKSWIKFSQSSNQNIDVGEAFAALKKTDQSVLTDFNASDLVDIYRVEGFAYEYWRALSAMRAIGKGAHLRIEDGEMLTEHDDEPKFSKLITAYDTRLDVEAHRVDVITSSTVGTWVIGGKNPKPVMPEGMVVVPVYNVAQADARPWFATLGFKLDTVGEGAATNFVPARLDLNNYLAAHAYIASAFEEKKGYSLKNYVRIIWALCHFNLFPEEFLRGDRNALLTAHLQLLRRGYRTYHRTGNPTYEGTIDRIRRFMNLPHDEEERLRNALPQIISDITLKPETQEKVALWSHGPRPLLILHGDVELVDLQGLPMNLATLFYGISLEAKPKDNAQESRGGQFEETVRQQLADEGYELVQRKPRLSDGRNKETDAAVRIGNLLVVCDCTSVHRRLDIERGSIPGTAQRSEKIRQKIEQAFEFMQFVKENRLGTNFDFTWAIEVIPIVVSPFVEWLWDDSEELWIDSKTPRVMTPEELLKFLASLKKRHAPTIGARLLKRLF
jgi:hypothetical protein